MINRLKRLSYTVVSFLACVALNHAACAQQLEPVRIGLSSVSMPSSAPKIANALGLFSKHGLNPTLIQMQDASANTMGLISGSVDFVTAQPTDVIVSQGRGQKLVAVSSVYRGFAIMLVVSKAAIDRMKVSAKAPVTDRLRALDGLVIASASATSAATLALKSATAAAGSHVRMTYMSQTAMVAALSNGAIQGFLASAPFYASAMRNGSGEIWLAGPDGDFPANSTLANNITLNTKLDYALAHRDLVTRMAAVFSDFGRTVRERPDAVKAAIKQVFPDLDPNTIDLVFEREARGWGGAGKLTEQEMAHDIAIVKAGGADLPMLDSISPADMIFR
jgi:ABC-type nitrate/sulfonate/bicarbonate transport system substrate-binding protein